MKNINPSHLTPSLPCMNIDSHISCQLGAVITMPSVKAWTSAAVLGDGRSSGGAVLSSK